MKHLSRKLFQVLLPFLCLSKWKPQQIPQMMCAMYVISLYAKNDAHIVDLYVHLFRYKGDSRHS